MKTDLHLKSQRQCIPLARVESFMNFEMGVGNNRKEKQANKQKTITKEMGVGCISQTGTQQYMMMILRQHYSNVDEQVLKHNLICF